MPATASIYLDYDEDWVITVDCKTATGTALNLVGATASLYFGDIADPVVTSPGLITNAAGGRVAFRVTPAEQTPLVENAYPFLVSVVLASGIVTHQVAGLATLTKR